jgi:hypothetical protein
MTNGDRSLARDIPDDAATKELGQNRPTIYYWLDIRQHDENFKHVTECLSIKSGGRTWHATGGHTTALEECLMGIPDQPLTESEVDQVMRWSSDMHPAPESHISYA